MLFHINGYVDVFRKGCHYLQYKPQPPLNNKCIRRGFVWQIIKCRGSFFYLKFDCVCSPTWRREARGAKPTSMLKVIWFLYFFAWHDKIIASFRHRGRTVGGQGPSIESERASQHRTINNCWQRTGPSSLSVATTSLRAL